MTTTTSDLLAEAPKRYRDSAWLDGHAQELVGEIYEALKRGGNHDAGINALLHVFPHFIHSENVKRWHKLNRKALKLARGRKRTDLSTEVVRLMYLLPPQQLESAPPKKKRSERVDPRELFEMYVNLLMENFFNHPQSFTPALVNRLLYVTSIVNVPFYYHKVYQILGLIYNYLGEYDKALDRLFMTRAYWRRSGDRLEQALTAYAIGVAYRGQNKRELAREWLQMAANWLAPLDYPEQREVVVAELATL